MDDRRQQRGIPPNVIRICIDFIDQDLKGRVYTKISGQVVTFKNCGELFLKTDALFDQCGFPQTFHEKRCFATQRNIGHYAVPRSILSDKDILQQQGNIKTFDVFIQSRRRVGWQGFVIEEDGHGKFQFQGVIELLHYIEKKISMEEKFMKGNFLDNQLEIRQEEKI